MNLLRSLKNNSNIEAAILIVAGFVLWLIASEFELFEALYEFSRAHEDWDLDELILAVQVIGLMGFIYGFRRIHELDKEIKLRNQAESDISWMAKHDILTKLPNRNFLDTHISSFDKSIQKSEELKLVVYAIDLDGFKKANDLLGHAGGDALLVEVADRLRILSADNLVFRMGGDEFIIIAKCGINEDIRQLATKIVSTVGTPFQIKDIHAEIGASVGIAYLLDTKSSLADTIRQADIALYQAKREGRGCIKVFDISMENILAQRAELESAFKKAMRDEEIIPHFQPLVDLETSQIYGFEALARWTQKNGKVIPPSVFIEVAEDLGLITDLSEKLLRKACLVAKEWPEDICLSFNISPTQLQDKLLGLRIIKILEEVKFPAQRLELEITETALIKQIDTAIQILNDLKGIGLKIALDDFGTGYSSLSQLSKFQFDRIKIDRSFISDFSSDEKTNKVVQTMIALGKGLEISITAEGIEEQEQQWKLQKMGCSAGQGYLFGKAMPAQEVNKFIFSICKSKSVELS